MKTRPCATANLCGQTTSINAARGLLVLAALLMPVLSLAQVPFIQEVQPPSAHTGGGDLLLTITGDGFGSGSSVNFNASNIACATVTNTQCTVTIPASNFASPGTAVISLVNSGPKTSNVVLFPVSTQQPPSFASELKPAGKTPQSVARGDFNGDGHQDLAVVNSGDNNVSILLGDGAANFTAAPGSPVAVGHNPQGIAVGDFNNDGKLDLAVVNENDNSVSILLGNGDGTFTLQPSSPATDIAPLAVAVADSNADGKLDLFVVNQTGTGCSTGSGSLSILQGDGTGAFSTYQTICLGVLASSIAVGDFNGDGLPDVAVNNGSGGSCAPSVGSVSVVLNNFFGVAGLFYPGFNSYCAGKGPTVVTTGDFNNDGKLDLVTGNVETNSVSVLIGNGDGSFQAPVNYDTGGGAVPVAFAVADLNLDGNLDLAVLNQGSSNISILLGNGDGTFQVPPPVYATTVTVSGQSHGISPVSLVAGDFNEDGRLDIATADSSDNFLSILLQGPAIKSFCVSPAPLVPGNFGCVGPPQPTQPPQPPPPPLPLLTFGNQPDGTSSQSQSVTITNTGSSSVALTNSSFTIAGGNYTAAPSCGTLAPGSSCTVSVMFSPGSNALGSLTASLQVSYSAGLSQNVTQTVATLSGTGIAPALGFVPQTLSFPATLVGTTNVVTEQVTVTNIGDFGVTLEGVTITGMNPSEFAITADNCSNSGLAAGVQGVSPGGSCQITVSFTPSASGSRIAQIDVPFYVDGGDSSHPVNEFVSLSGAGAAPAVNFAPTPLTFGDQPVGTSSTSQNVTLLNDGTYALTINGVVSSDPQFTAVNHCPSTLAVNTSCTVAVTFTPTGVGTQNASLTFTDNNNAVNNSQQVVGLVGTGAGPLVSLAIAPQTFGNQQVGTTSAPSTVFLSNLGNAPLAISNVAITNDSSEFTIVSNSCGSTLAVGKSCTVTVTFKPSAVGPRAGILTFTDNDDAVSGSMQTVNLTGTGTAPSVSLVGLSGGNNLAFGGVPKGTTSAPMSFAISNTGTAALVITSIVSSDSPEFVESDNCGTKPAMLAANANCTVTVAFTPSTTGARVATLTLTDNNGGSPTTITTQTVYLSGTGTDFSISASPATVTVSPGKFASYTLTLTPSSGFTGNVTLACNVVPAASKTTCTTPISVAVTSPSTMFISASAKNSTKGTYTLNFFATFTATPPAAGTLSHSTSSKLTVK